MGQLPGHPIAVSPRPAGGLVAADGSPLDARLVLARNSVTLVGKRVQQVAQGDEEPGLTLWRTPSAPRVSTWRQGLQGTDLTGPVKVTVFDCRGGRLELTLHALEGLPAVTVSVDGLAPHRVALEPNSLVRGYIPARPARGRCTFRLVPAGRLKTPRIVFVRGKLEPAGSTFVRTSTVSLAKTKERIAYCIGGSFQVLPAGTAKDGTPANFVAGKGLTCEVPAGYSRHGFAGAGLGVPAETYPYFAP
jgi:hypothetical protein